MADLEELVVSLVAETSGLRAELQKATAATKDASSKMDDALQAFTDNSSKNLSFFESAMASMTGFLAADAVQAVVGFAKDGLDFMKEHLVEGAHAAIEEENALKRLSNSLAISGHYSAEAAKSLQDFTADMENLTGVEDHVIASNLATLSSLTRLDAEGLKRAQKAALDMSVALGMDLDSATRLVGKGVEGNVEMFKRYGITIQEGSTKAETMANTLKKLEASFGGAAQGAAQTFGGAMTILKNSMGNVTEALATIITKNPAVVAMMNALTEVFRNLEEYVKQNATALKEDLAAALVLVAKTLGYMAQVGDEVWRLLKAGVYAFLTGLEVIGGSIAYLLDKLGIMKDADPFGPMNQGIHAFNDTVNNESNLGKLATALADVGYAGEEGMKKISDASDVVTASVKTQQIAHEELSGKQKELYTQFAQGLADEGAALDARYQYENELRQVNLDIELASLTEHNQNKWDLMAQDIATQEEMTAAHQEKEWTDLQTAYANKLITDTQYNDAKTALSQKQYLELKKIEADKTKLQQAEEAARMQGYGTFLQGMSVLQQSGSKEMVAIGKAAAITKATIDAYVAIQNALSSVPFPANIAAAAGIGVMAFANVAKIAGIGFNEGGTLVGGGANMDSVPASLTKGETVVTRDLTTQLADFLARQKDGGGSGEVRVILELKDSLVEFIEAKILERQASRTSLLGTGVI